MKDRENLESLYEFLKFAQKEIKLALDEKQTLSDTAKNLSITPQRMNNIKTAPRYFDYLIKDHFMSVEDFAEILKANQLMEEQLFKITFNVDNDKIVSLSEEEIDIIDEIIDESLSDRQKDVILKRFADGMTLEEVGDTLNVTRERIRQIEARAIRILKHRIYESFKKTYIKDDLSTENVIDAVRDNDIKTTFYESVIQKTLKTDKFVNLDMNQENAFKEYFKNELKIDPSYSSKKELVDLLQENNQIFYELMMRLYPNININIDTTINDSRMKLTPIDDLDLSSRTKNILKRLHVEVLEDLQHYRVWDLVFVRNLGQKSLDELKKVMEEHNLEFKE